MHSSNISFLNFSDNNSLVISGSVNDNYVNLWHLKSKTTDPLIKLLTNSVVCKASLYFMEKGVYHCFCYNKKFIFGYKLILSEINPDMPQNPELEIGFQDTSSSSRENSTSLLSLEKNTNDSIFFIYGNPYLLKSKVIKYAKNPREFKEKSIQIQKLNKNNLEKSNTNLHEQNQKVLNEIEMNENLEDTTEINSEFKTILTKIKDGNKNNEVSTKINDSKISLLNVLRNSVINNDNKAFDWALNQKVILL